MSDHNNTAPDPMDLKEFTPPQVTILRHPLTQQTALAGFQGFHMWGMRNHPLYRLAFEQGESLQLSDPDQLRYCLALMVHLACKQDHYLLQYFKEHGSLPGMVVAEDPEKLSGE